MGIASERLRYCMYSCRDLCGMLVVICCLCSPRSSQSKGSLLDEGKLCRSCELYGHSVSL